MCCFFMITEATFRKAFDKTGRKHQRADTHYSAHKCRPTRCCWFYSRTSPTSSQLCLVHLPRDTSLKREWIKAMQTGLWQGDTADLSACHSPHATCHHLLPLPGPIHGVCLSCSQHWLIYYKHLTFSAAVPAGNGSAGLRTEGLWWNESGIGKKTFYGDRVTDKERCVMSLLFSSTTCSEEEINNGSVDKLAKLLPESLVIFRWDAQFLIFN